MILEYPNLVMILSIKKILKMIIKQTIKAFKTDLKGLVRSFQGPDQIELVKHFKRLVTRKVLKFKQSMKSVKLKIKLPVMSKI